MHIITGRNVNAVYAQAIQLVRTKGMLQPSRAGDVLAVPEPVVLETLQPMERVLLDPKRDANPFFHFFEALWMLAGRNDAAFLDRFVKTFSTRFAEEDGHQHGAYGYRWRHQFGVDQLEVVISKMKDYPLDRRVVIQMWDCTPQFSGVFEGDGGADDLNPTFADVPCNTHIYPRIVNGALDLMVCCRSNDVVWGACGANAVHFAFLQEYLAGRIGCRVGTLRQMTTNLHGYTKTLAKVGNAAEVDYYLDGSQEPAEVSSLPIGTDWEHWDEDLHRFLEMVEHREYDREVDKFHNDWFASVAVPMWYSHAYWRLGHSASAYLVIADQIQAPDWRLAAQQWFERRKK